MANTSLILDANVLLRPEGIDLSRDYLTTPSVRDEIKSKSGRINLSAIQLESRKPSDRSVKKVRDKSKEINSRVSDQDIDLAALAMDTNSKILTDDLDLQNLCVHLDIEFEGIMNEIDETRNWKLVCPRCGDEFDGENCSSCGFSGAPERKTVD